MGCSQHTMTFVLEGVDCGSKHPRGRIKRLPPSCWNYGNLQESLNNSIVGRSRLPVYSVVGDQQ